MKRFSASTIPAAVVVLTAVAACSPDEPRLVECTTGATGCYDNAHQITCVDGEWGEPEACVAQTCAVDRCVGECAEGQTRCGAGHQEVCAADGTWKLSMQCDDGCELVEGKPTCTGCDDGATECVDTANVRTCTNGNWATSVCTDQTCIADACAGECAQGQTRCAAQGSAVHACQADGTWGEASSCDAGDAWSWQVCRGSECVESPDYEHGYTSVDSAGWMTSTFVAHQWRTHSLSFGVRVRVFRVAVHLTDVAAGTRLKMAVWDNRDGPFGDQPNALIAATSESNVSAGWNVLDLVYAEDPPVLEPGATYWIGMVAANQDGGTASFHYRMGSGRNANLANSWDTPNPFPSVRASDDGHRYGVYAVVKALE